MKIKTNKSGFTLLEIIIVIIIVGVLASLALPRFFATVEFSRSTEAFASLAAVRQSVERCYLMTRDYTECDENFNELDLEDPGTSPGAHFGYGVAASSATAYTITATRNTLDGGAAGDTDTIVLSADDTGVTRTGTGAFSGIK
ncbi:MAG: prepilin-type N-terminal cleavage/methylation domain-containing protein [Candidatus Omnitrophica bacterium]|nr:prepilin-type N-terminal cleavage/methylation domain-containing protein [Candidatus Omnitrophota bacterium]